MIIVGSEHTDGENMRFARLTAATLILMALWLAFVIVTALFGWWMRPIAPTGDSDAFFRQAADRIAEQNAGNAAFMLIEDGAISREYYSTSKDLIDRDTVFATASMSKWLTAAGVMKLVQDGEVELDAPMSAYVSRWALPTGEFDDNEITVRRLLSHTAGLTDELGFGDYHLDEVIPSLEESLNNPRASDGRTARIAVTVAPGTEWKYSGGSYLILQLLIEEVSGTSFEEYMREAFFIPLGMSRSSYEPLSSVDNNAGSFNRHGESTPIYQYASSGATGFATSTADLAKFVTAQILPQDTDSILNHNTLAAMRQAHGKTLGFDVWGLGTILYAPTGTGDFVFGHDGSNDPAINSTARINPDTRDAIILLETGHPSLATNIGSQWVLWQTGYPDILDTDSVIQSMRLPGLLGLLIIFLASVYIGLRHKRRHGQHSVNTGQNRTSAIT